MELSNLDLNNNHASISSRLDLDNDRFLTVPTVFMTLPRSAWSIIAPYRAINGQTTFWQNGFAALSDNEGAVCSIIDKLWPNSTFGASTHGKRLDFGVDAAMVAGTSIADMAGKHSHPLTRAAGAITAARVLKQATLARPYMHEYRELTAKGLSIDVGWLGKSATYATLLATQMNAISRDAAFITPETKTLRRRTAIGGFIMATTGYVLGCYSNQENQVKFEAALAQARTEIV